MRASAEHALATGRTLTKTTFPSPWEPQHQRFLEFGKQGKPTSRLQAYDNIHVFMVLMRKSQRSSASSRQHPHTLRSRNSGLLVPRRGSSLAVKTSSLELRWTAVHLVPTRGGHRLGRAPYRRQAPGLQRPLKSGDILPHSGQTIMSSTEHARCAAYSLDLPGHSEAMYAVQACQEHAFSGRLAGSDSALVYRYRCSYPGQQAR